ncbi:hypothetical protein GCM10010289_63280 [Streptomyces violascens]|uniref:Uncharacterized protein n=1 Tax=Streptomyces violascens TaxID=67381 RepID=A0ABQ3QSL0_9ACTN|nr:hypothetical protein GCM10010289_63280 [Streptomyces violascens]GHI40269.1 hypothetical protein Sviol_46770 [Streptomyces violascens]
MDQKTVPTTRATLYRGTFLPPVLVPRPVRTHRPAHATPLVCCASPWAVAANGGGFRACAWATLAWLAVTGRVELATAATAVVAVQTSLAALSPLVIYGAAMFHTSLYHSEIRSSLDLADDLAPKRGAAAVPQSVGEIHLDDVVYQYRQGHPCGQSCLPHPGAW